MKAWSSLPKFINFISIGLQLSNEFGKKDGFSSSAWVNVQYWQPLSTINYDKVRYIWISLFDVDTGNPGQVLYLNIALTKHQDVWYHMSDY